MAHFLHFRLYGPMASWGEPAANDIRPSAVQPGRAAILGLVGAALGIDRQDAEAVRRLNEGYSLAILIEREGVPMDDYHTAQVARDVDLKKAPHRTRSDELNFPRRDLSTVLSRRGYRCDAVYAVLLWPRTPAAWPLTEVAERLRRPHYRLSLGRLACPLALPLVPVVIDAPTVVEALAQAPAALAGFPGQLARHLTPRPPASVSPSGPATPEQAAPDPVAPALRLYWDPRDQPHIGLAPDATTPRRDHATDRRRWLFTDRLEARGRYTPAPGGRT